VLATGVGKTRLMGAFISYLYLAYGIKNFFVLAPNLTIYDKLLGDFSQGNPKYVFKGVSEFAVSPPIITNGENYEQQLGDLFPVRINIFNISKINSEVRGGRSPRIRSFREEIGESYFEYLAGLDDLVLIMDESHRYRASAGIRAINELKPVLGLELTATPFVETNRGPTPFKNVIFDYPLGRAMADGFVKEPAVVTRKNFNPAGMSVEEVERLKLEDGIRLHESVKVELETYARETMNPIVKPFVLVIARDTTHASQLIQLIQSDSFFEGRYASKVIQVDSSRTSAYTAAAGQQPLDFRTSPADKSNMSKYIFGGFSKCLYLVQKFQSEAERKLAVILERDATKWFKPAKGQFQIYYKSGTDSPEYQPDFVAETDDRIYMLEPKAANEMTDAEVLAKRDAAIAWCKRASVHARSYRGKEWVYLLIPHDVIAENMTLEGLAKRH
jgi:hypothetical protein